jgi:hypothetical protein
MYRAKLKHHKLKAPAAEQPEGGILAA